MTNINKYQYGVIYKITNTEDPDMVYIGSTTNELSVRMIKHKSNAKNRPGLSKLYTYMNEIGINKFEIVEIEQYPCVSVEQLRKREGEVIRELGTLNKEIAGRTNKEYKEEHEDSIKEWKKQHYQDNKEILAEKGKQYYEDNKERIQEQHKQYRLEHLEEEKERGKHYRENNQDKIREYKKQWCEENQERLIEQRKHYYQDNKEELELNIKSI